MIQPIVPSGKEERRPMLLVLLASAVLAMGASTTFSAIEIDQREVPGLAIDTADLPALFTDLPTTVHLPLSQPGPAEQIGPFANSNLYRSLILNARGLKHRQYRCNAWRYRQIRQLTFHHQRLSDPPGVLENYAYTGPIGLGKV